MDLYGISLLTGAAGLGAMAITGLSHAVGHGGHGHGAHGGHAGHGGHDAHAGHAGHVGHAGHAGHLSHGGHDAHGHAPAHDAGAGHALSGWVQNLLSPRVLFALLVGFGAGGLLATPLGEPWRALAGIAGAGGFETMLVGPLWRFLFRFESAPALTLDSAVEDSVRAVTSFDTNGHGLVALDLDGQVVQLLATLSAADRARGARVRTGDELLVSSVDTARNRCIVRLPD